MENRTRRLDDLLLLTDKNIIIFGGGGLIGRSLTARVLANGASVTVASRSADGRSFDDVSEDDRKRLRFVDVNINDPAALDALFTGASEAGTPFDAVVNCSFPRSDVYGARFEDVEYEAFCKNVSLHLGGAFLVCQKAAAHFEASGGGNIINIASIYGVMTPRFEIYEGTDMTKEVEYIVCKAAIIHLTKYLAKYLKGRNIRVNCVSPGGVLNDEPSAFLENYNAHCMNKGMLDGDDVAGTVLFLLSDHSKFVTGQNIVVDDGFSL